MNPVRKMSVIPDGVPALTENCTPPCVADAVHALPVQVSWSRGAPPHGSTLSDTTPPAGLIVAVPILAFVMVLIRHVLLGEVYGDPISEFKPSGTVPADAKTTITSQPVTP